MRRTGSPGLKVRVLSFAGAAIAGAVLTATLACRRPPESQPNMTAAPPAASPAAGSPDASAAPGSPASSPETLCAQVTPAAVGAITSASYSTTTSQVETAAMKHCEYRGGLNTVSLMLVLGPGARERFDMSTRFPGIQPVSGVGDRANWEPVRGTLSILAGDRAVEVTVSSSHGAGPARQQLAQQIAQLLVR